MRYYNPSEEETITIENRHVIRKTEIEDMETKVDKLSKLLDQLMRDVTDLHGRLLHLNVTLDNPTGNEPVKETKKEMKNLLNVKDIKSVQSKINIQENTSHANQLNQSTKGKIGSSEVIVHISPSGEVAVNNTLLIKYLNNSLRKWDYKNEVIAFMHIGKNGGTSFRKGLISAKHDSGCLLKDTGNVNKPKSYPCPGQVPCVCNRHYDWTVIQKMETHGVKVATVALLRHPVERSISHFYFAQTLPWTKGTVMRQQSISQYLRDPQSMLNTRDIWQDGQVKF